MLKSGAIVWIPSKIWFSFLAKRLRVLRDTQILLERREAPNYGIMTGILAYMMQSVIFTPTLVSPFVSESLDLLYYKQVVDRFGMFFLHDLDLTLENCLPSVLDRDDADVLGAMGVKARKKKARMPSPDTEDEDEFPIGKKPNWKQVERCLKERPWVLMKQWRWQPEWGDTLDRASQLFILFTVHMWASLNERWHAPGASAVHPTTLQEALEQWTIKGVHATAASVNYLACNAGLLGSVKGQRVKSFADRVDVYFPPIGEELFGVWRPLGENPGYISEYREEMNGLNLVDAELLRDGLRQLLSHCQCLPNGRRGDKFGGRNAIWEVNGSSVAVLTNPLFYKLERISMQGTKSIQKRRAPTHTGSKKLQQAMLEHRGVQPDVARKALKAKRSMNLRRSMKAKNIRAPPKKKAAVKEAMVVASSPMYMEEGEVSREEVDEEVSGEEEGEEVSGEEEDEEISREETDTEFSGEGSESERSDRDSYGESDEEDEG